jgi:hypothetical protein
LRPLTTNYAGPLINIREKGCIEKGSLRVVWRKIGIWMKQKVLVEIKAEKVESIFCTDLQPILSGQTPVTRQIIRFIENHVVTSKSRKFLLKVEKSGKFLHVAQK